MALIYGVSYGDLKKYSVCRFTDVMTKATSRAAPVLTFEVPKKITTCLPVGTFVPKMREL